MDHNFFLLDDTPCDHGTFRSLRIMTPTMVSYGGAQSRPAQSRPEGTAGLVGAAGLVSAPIPPSIGADYTHDFKWRGVWVSRLWRAVSPQNKDHL